MDKNKTKLIIDDPINLFFNFVNTIILIWLIFIYKDYKVYIISQAFEDCINNRMHTEYKVTLDTDPTDINLTKVLEDVQYFYNNKPLPNVSLENYIMNPNNI